MIRVKLDLQDAQKTELRLAINRNGKAQKKFTHKVKSMCDKYVPLDKGILKNTAIEDDNSITYIQPYAEHNYYYNSGKGTQGMTKQGGRGGLNKNCLRGKLWDKRMWADHGDEIVAYVANYVGGRAKK